MRELELQQEISKWDCAPWLVTRVLLSFCISWGSVLCLIVYYESLKLACSVNFKLGYLQLWELLPDVASRPSFFSCLAQIWELGRAGLFLQGSFPFLDSTRLSSALVQGISWDTPHAEDPSPPLPILGELGRNKHFLPAALRRILVQPGRWWVSAFFFFCFLEPPNDFQNIFTPQLRNSNPALFFLAESPNCIIRTNHNQKGHLFPTTRI